MSQNHQSPVITWPFWGEPFEKTPRGYLCHRKTTGATFRAFFAVCAFLVPTACIVLVVLARGYRVDVEIPEIIVGLLVLPVLGALLASTLVAVLLVRPLRPIVREAQEDAEQWRTRWLAFEQSSLALQERIRDTGYRLEDAYSKAPVTPAYSYRLQNHLSIVIAECGIPFDRQDAIERARHLLDYGLSAVLCNLVRMGGPMVVGRVGKAGIVAIFAPLNGYQVWAQVQFEQSGGALVPRLLIGIQTWSHRFQDRQGTRYPGDMARIKQHHRGVYATYLLYAFPFWGWIHAIGCLYSFVSEYFHTDQVASFRAELWPECGDSSDVVIISGFKQVIPGAAGWVFSTPETQDMLDSLKRRILEAVTVSLGRTV